MTVSLRRARKLIRKRHTCYDTLVDDPSQQDLARVDCILLRQGLEDGVQRASSEPCDGQLRTVRSKLDVLRFVVGNEIPVLKIRVISASWSAKRCLQCRQFEASLNLVDGGPDFGRFQDCVQVWLQVVRDTNRLEACQ